MTHRFRTTAMVVAATAVLLTACSGGTPPSDPAVGPPLTTVPPTTIPPTSAPPTSTTTTAQGSGGNPDRCTTAELTASLGYGDAGAGSVYRPLLLTNTGDRSCELTGFPGVSYVTGDGGEQVGPAAAMDGERGGPVPLAVGRSASAQLRMVDVGNFDAAACLPTPVRGLRIYPPGDTAALFVPLETTGCAGTPPGDQIGVQTLMPG